MACTRHRAREPQAGGTWADRNDDDNETITKILVMSFTHGRPTLAYLPVRRTWRVPDASGRRLAETLAAMVLTELGNGRKTMPPAQFTAAERKLEVPTIWAAHCRPAWTFALQVCPAPSMFVRICQLRSNFGCVWRVAFYEMSIEGIVHDRPARNLMNRNFARKWAPKARTWRIVISFIRRRFWL